MPVAVDDGHVGTELRADQGRFVAARAATDDHDARHAGHDSLQAVVLYAAYGSNLDPAQDGRALPAFPARGTGWLAGWRLTFAGEEHGWDGALATMVEAPSRRSSSRCTR